MILRGSPAILSDPEFGLCSRLRLRSPHARVEVPGSTSGGRCRARRRRRGPSGNVVPARTRAAFPQPGPPPPSSPPQPRPEAVGGSDAPRRGRDLGEAARAARSSGARGRASRAAVRDWAAGARGPLPGGHARAGGRRNRSPASDVAHSFTCSSIHCITLSGLCARLVPQTPQVQASAVSSGGNEGLQLHCRAFGCRSR